MMEKLFFLSCWIDENKLCDVCDGELWKGSVAIVMDLNHPSLCIRMDSVFRFFVLGGHDICRLSS